MIKKNLKNCQREKRDNAYRRKNKDDIRFLIRNNASKTKTPSKPSGTTYLKYWKKNSVILEFYRQQTYLSKTKAVSRHFQTYKSWKNSASGGRIRRNVKGNPSGGKNYARWKSEFIQMNEECWSGNFKDKYVKFLSYYLRHKNSVDYLNQKLLIYATT